VSDKPLKVVLTAVLSSIFLCSAASAGKKVAGCVRAVIRSFGAVAGSARGILGRHNKVFPSEEAPLCKRIYDYSATRILIY